MKFVECTYSDGNTTRTNINGTIEEIENYFIGQWFNFGDSDEHPQDNMQQCVKVELLRP